MRWIDIRLGKRIYWPNRTGPTEEVMQKQVQVVLELDKVNFVVAPELVEAPKITFKVIDPQALSENAAIMAAQPEPSTPFLRS